MQQMQNWKVLIAEVKQMNIAGIVILSSVLGGMSGAMVWAWISMYTERGKKNDKI